MIISYVIDLVQICYCIICIFERLSYFMNKQYYNQNHVCAMMTHGCLLIITPHWQCVRYQKIISYLEFWLHISKSPGRKVRFIDKIILNEGKHQLFRKKYICTFKNNIDIIIDRMIIGKQQINTPSSILLTKFITRMGVFTIVYNCSHDHQIYFRRFWYNFLVW